MRCSGRRAAACGRARSDPSPATEAGFCAINAGTSPPATTSTPGPASTMSVPMRRSSSPIPAVRLRRDTLMTTVTFGHGNPHRGDRQLVERMIETNRAADNTHLPPIMTAGLVAAPLGAQRVPIRCRRADLPIPKRKVVGWTPTWGTETAWSKGVRPPCGTERLSCAPLRRYRHSCRPLRAVAVREWATAARASRTALPTLPIPRNA